MKRRMGQKFKRVLTFIMSAIMVVETINCVSMTALASDGITVSAGDAIVVTEGLADKVNDAESAAVAADLAAEKAEDALKLAESLSNAAADAALETAPDGSYTVPDVSGNSVPVLNNDIDQKVTEAKNKVTEANNINEEITKETQKEIDKVAQEAVEKTEDQLGIATGAATDAQNAAKKAQEELTNALNATDYNTAQKAANAANAAYEDAKKAEEVAKRAKEEADAVLSAAIQAVNDAANACSISTGDSSAASVAAINAVNKAQEVLDEAKEIVANSELAYNQAAANAETAKITAENAAKEAKSISTGLVDDLKTEAEQSLVDLQHNKTEKQTLLDNANSELAKAEKEVTDNKDTSDYLKNMTSKGIFSGTSKLDEITELSQKTTNDVKYTLPFGIKIYYSSKEIKDAQDELVKYNNALEKMNKLNANLSNAQDAKEAAEKENSKVSQQITDKQVELAGIEASRKTVDNFIYNNKDADVYDFSNDDTCKSLLEEMESSYRSYISSQNLRENYEESIDMDCDLATKFDRLMKQIDYEIKYNGANIYFDWSKFKFVYSNNGLTMLIGKNEDNRQVLISFEKDAMGVAVVDEIEYAKYATTFDAVAAAGYAQRAADAAQKAVEAKDKLDKAKEALELAQARLDEAKLKKWDLDKAQLELEKAQLNVDKTNAAYLAAKDAAKIASEAAEEAKVLPETKPVTAAFYVLNRGLSQPEEVKSYPKPNYSNSPILGELYSGVLDEASGLRDYSYVPLYKRGVGNESLVGQYLMVEPTKEQLEAAGVVLKEGESIKWYVIKNVVDGFHVDGFIVNQKFNVKVLYGYLDTDGNFVEFTKNDGTTYEQNGIFTLGETYEFESPVIDEYIMETDKVTGVATTDTTIKVTYTKEPTIPVIINYYRGSITGTLLKTVPLNVAVSKIETYKDAILSNWLNNEKPADCNNGVLISYYFNEAKKAWVGNIVYSPIPADVPTPGPSPEPTPTPIVEDVPPIVINDEATPTTVRTIRPSAPTPVEENVDEEPIEVPEEETPLADVPESDGDTTDEEQEVINIEEEETPLAAGQNCWIHWLILIITAVYTLFELVRSVMRNKKIRELSERSQSVEA